MIASNNSAFQNGLSCVFSEVVNLVNLKYGLCSYESNWIEGKNISFGDRRICPHVLTALFIRCLTLESALISLSLSFQICERGTIIPSL